LTATAFGYRSVYYWYAKYYNVLVACESRALESWRKKISKGHKLCWTIGAGALLMYDQFWPL